MTIFWQYKTRVPKRLSLYVCWCSFQAYMRTKLKAKNGFGIHYTELYCRGWTNLLTKWNPRIDEGILDHICANERNDYLWMVFSPKLSNTVWDDSPQNWPPVQYRNIDNYLTNNNMVLAHIYIAIKVFHKAISWS